MWYKSCHVRDRKATKGSRVVFSTNVRIGLGRRKIIFKPLWHETKHEIWLINNKWISTCDNTQWNLNTEIKNIINSLSYNSSCCTSHKNNNIMLFAVSSSMFWLQSLMHCKMQELPLKPPMLYQVMVCWKHNSFCCAVFNLCAQNTSFKHGDKICSRHVLSLFDKPCSFIFVQLGYNYAHLEIKIKYLWWCDRLYSWLT